MKKYDYIIIGGGCAGLSLAFHMKKKGLSGKKILILEEKKKEKNDRTWCFWSAHKPEFGDLPVKSWDTLAFKSDDFRQVEKMDKLKYYYIKGSEYYQTIRSYIQDDPMFEYREERAASILTEEDKVLVHTSNHVYEANWAFNSIPDKSVKGESDIWLKQHFIGYFLETKDEVFNPTEVTFMDFSTSYPNAFMYVLPFSPTRALVEFTVFSESVWDDRIYIEEIKAYLAKKGVNQDFEIKEVEKGAIPMSSHLFSRKDSERVINIGTRGGMTKPTTGYTFLNIQRDSQHIVDQLIRTGSPSYSSANKKKRYRFYDNLLLDIIKQEPEQVKGIMTTLFRKNKVSTILRFLDEKTPLRAELMLLLRLPWLPFFRAIYRFYIHGKITSTVEPARSLVKSPYPAPKPGRISPVD